MTGARLAVALAVAAISPVLVGPARASVGDVTLVADPAGSGPDRVTDPRFRPAISRTGRIVAYPQAESLRGVALYIRDRFLTQPTVVVESPGPRGFGSWDIASPALSADGRYLAFASDDPALSPEDDTGYHGKGTQDIFVHDLLRGSTTLVSRGSGALGDAGDSDSSVPSISANGRYVAFGTEASNLVPEELYVGGVFVRDLHAKTTTRVAGFPGMSIFRPDVFDPSISGSGGRVAYVVQVGPFFGERRQQIAVRRLAPGRTTLASRESGDEGGLANYDCREPSISTNGRFVAYVSGATNLVDSATRGVENVFVRDLKTERTLLVSRGPGPHGRAANGDSWRPSISASGRYVAFQTKAGNLSPGDRDDQLDVYVKDLQTGDLVLASHGPDGTSADGASALPAVSGDGRFVVYNSTATNLSPEDTGSGISAFLTQLLP